MTAVRPTHVPPLAAVYRRARLWREDTVWSAWLATTRQRPTRVAIVDGTTRATFADVAAAADRLAAGLAALGTRAGDAVAFQLPNWLETVVVLLACARLGAVATPILPIHRRREVSFILRQSGARVLFVPGRRRDCDHRELAASLRDETPALAHVIVVRDEPGPGMLGWAPIAGSAAPSPPAVTDATAIALLLYTSGTTADPKGVLHSHETLLAEARSLAPAHALHPGDVVLMPSPLTHVSGIVHALLVPAALGTAAVLMERWEPKAALALIASERVTYMVGAPTFLRDLAQHPALERHDVSSLRLFSCGGADVEPTLVREAARRLGCVAKRVYGSSEFPTVTTTAPGDPPDRRIDSEGRAIGAVEVALVDNAGAPVPAGCEGEVLARGPECFLGYLDPALDADAFTPDGWFRTGDLGVLDAAGYLRITGRTKDIIIRKGEKLSARELEDLIAGHPAVAEVAVVGVPDPAAGEIACAVVRPRAGVAPPTLTALGEFLTAHGLSRRKLPERLEIVDDFPRTGTGKILKRALRERLGG